jgi:hypothetical protein
VPGLVDAAESMLVRTRTRRPAPSLAPSPSPSPAASPAASSGPSSAALSEPLDAGRLTGLLRGVLGRDDDAHPVTVVSVRDVRRTPGRRCVVSCTVHGLPGPAAGADRPVQLIGKAFGEPGRAELLYDHLLRLNEGPFGAGDLLVPRPVALLPEQHLVLYRAVTGARLDRVRDPDRLDDGVRRAARWLARLHASRVELPRSLSWEREQASSHEWAGLVGARCPELAVPAQRLADRWPTALPPHPAGRQSPLHKDFHPGHALLGTALSVIDLDEARMGEATFDVAHFSTYLELFHPDRPALREVFLNEYEATSGGVDADAFRPIGAYTWLKIAKQAAAGSGPFRHVSAPERGHAAGRALARGLRCLSA